MKMNYGSDTLMINAEGLSLRPSMLEVIRKQAGSVLRRHPRLLGMKIDLKLDSAKQSYRSHVARIRLVLPGYDKVVEKKGTELGALLGRAFEVANRQMRKRARERRTKRRL